MYFVWYQNWWSLGRWLVNYIRGQVRGTTLETGGYIRVGFRSCGTVGYGPTMWVKNRSGDISHGHNSKACQRVACQLYVSNIVGTKGEGRREPFSCSLQRGGPIGKVLVHRWWPECYRQFQQGLTDRVVHRGVYISRRILLLRSYRSPERLNQTMERKIWLSD